MPDSRGADNPSGSLLVPLHSEKKDRERMAKKCMLATCAIGKEIPGHGEGLVGTGSLVKDFFEDSSRKVHLITSDRVISSHDLSSYFLRFKKLNGNNKGSRMLLSICDDKIFYSHGLAIVPVDPKKFNSAKKRTSGLLNHRPFTINTARNQFLRKCDLYCHVVEESDKKVFTTRLCKVMGIVDEETYLADLLETPGKIEGASVYSGSQKGLGAPITITGENDVAEAVGAITLGNNQQISFVLFSQIKRSPLPSVRGEAEGCRGPEETGVQPTGALAEGRDGNPPTHGQGLIIVTVPIVMDLKEEWKCTGNSMENMHTDVRGNFLLCILHDTNNFDPSKYTKSKKEPFFFQIHHNDEDGFSASFKADGSRAEGCQGLEETGVQPTEALAEGRDGNLPTHGQVSRLVAPYLKYTEEKMNYHMLLRVVTDVVPEGLREIFKQEWDNRYKTNLGEWKDTPDDGKNFCTIIRPQSRGINHYLLKTIEKGNRAEWDGSMLCFAILNCDSPDNLNPRIKSNVGDLRYLRNELVHWSTVEISNEYFRTKISKIKNAFHELGLREPEIPGPEIGFSPEEFIAALEELGDIKKKVEELEKKFVRKLTTF